MHYTRFLVLGDSFSEGMSDEIINGKYRGWADRVADQMSHTHPEFTYMNLAIRGKLIAQVVKDQVPEVKANKTSLKVIEENKKRLGVPGLGL